MIGQRGVQALLRGIAAIAMDGTAFWSLKLFLHPPPLFSFIGI
jgi:hypothetical protein